MRTREGICHLCGEFSKLSFEHVPPESAFNNKKVVIPDARRVIELDDLDKLKDLPGKQFQRGQGGYTLCVACNTITGRRYGAAYADWVYQGAEHVSRARTSDTNLAYPFHILPSRVLKQIASMFFSINPLAFQKKQSELTRFVLNRDAKHVPEPLRFFVGYLRSPIARRSAISVSLNAKTGVARVISELTFHPFSYILSIDGEPPKYPMLDITWFGHAAYNDFRSLHLPIPSIEAYTPFPGDFRPREQVIREAGSQASNED